MARHPRAAECGTALRLLLVAVATAMPVPAIASDLLVAELEQRLPREGVDGVNGHLASHGFDAGTLQEATLRCELPAVALSVQLSRGKSSKPVVEAHREALRNAVGRCTGFVLALLTPAEVPRICASVSTWSVTQTARELRRRMRSIEADEVLRSSRRGKACSAAYLFELQNTRVGIRVDPPAR